MAKCEWCGGGRAMDLMYHRCTCDTCKDIILAERIKYNAAMLTASKNYEFKLSQEIDPFIPLKTFDPHNVPDRKEIKAKREYLKVLKERNIEASKELGRWFAAMKK